ncbi:MAG: polymerase subunit tau [Pseudomonadota bacterium]|jgi:DNA polymerase-3 subunit gamma/tau
MSYLVLARKYRPRSFTEMVGQEHVVQALTNALTTQRLHHAYLFTGTRGVGKTTVSRILAKSLNCTGVDGQGGITATPCGVCQACRDIDAGRFVDYTELDAASNRGVDEVQSLLEQAVYKPVQGRFKVFMIDEVHMLSNTAFNAMLKTLEEPPEYLKFVLATTDPQKVPVTVLSRCLQFNLRPMAPETVQEHLARVLAAENIAADAQALRLLSRAARGSMRDALSLTDQAIAFGSGQLQEQTIRTMLGSVSRSVVFGLISSLAQGDGRAVVDAVESLRVQGHSAASALEEMTHVLQRMAVIQVAGADAQSDDPDVAEIERLAAALPKDETQLLYSMVLHGRNELGLAPDEYAAMTMVLLRLLAFKPGAAPVARPAQTAGGAVSPAKKPEPPVARAVAPAPVAASIATPVAPANPAVEAPVDLPTPPIADPPLETAHTPATPQADSDTRLTNHWAKVVDELIAAEAITALVRELALQSQCVAAQQGEVRLRVPRESLAQAGLRDRLEAALHAQGHDVKLTVEVGPAQDTPAQRLAAAQQARMDEALALIENDPVTQQMMRDFGAKIVPGSVILTP